MFGNEIVDDHFNVGLYAMGHAFFFDRQLYENQGEMATEMLNKFLHLSEEELVKIRQNHSILLRSYAGENSAEFFYHNY